MKDYTYTQAMQRLEAILAQLEEGSSNVDTLADLVKEATELVKFCRAKLRKTEDEVQNAFEGMSWKIWKNNYISYSIGIQCKSADLANHLLLDRLQKFTRDAHQNVLVNARNSN